MSSDGIMRVYVVYDHPTDYPDDYCVRVQEFLLSENKFRWGNFYKNPELKYVRQWIEGHAMRYGVGPVCMNRHPKDDPVILETWI